MPLNAYHTGKEEVICILHYSRPEQELDVDSLECVECGEPLYIRSPQVRITHFCHYPESANSCGLGESVRHAAAKIRVADFMKKTAVGQCDVSLEHMVGVRRADVMVHYPSGQSVVHEIQLSPLPVSDIRSRSLDYFERGLPVHWWFGPEIPEDTVEWTTVNLGGCSTLDFEVQTEETQDLEPQD